MALEERDLDTEHYVEFENLSPYSTTSVYSDAPAYYQSEYEWQQQQQQSNLHHQQTTHYPHQQIQHSQSLMESDRQLFSNYPTPTSDVSSPAAYHGYSQHPVVSATDFYQPSSNLWVPNATETLSMTSMHPTHRFFSGIDLSQQTRGHQNGGTSGTTGKPKRKRVQSLTQRKAANVRERRRMFHLNEAFDELRKRLPAFNYEKRLSRIETLRLAMTYISFMKDVSVGTDPKTVKLKPHGSDLDSSSLSFNGQLVGRGSFSDHGMENDEESDDSVDEHSNHSGGN